MKNRSLRRVLLLPVAVMALLSGNALADDDFDDGDCREMCSNTIKQCTDACDAHAKNEKGRNACRAECEKGRTVCQEKCDKR